MKFPSLSRKFWVAITTLLVIGGLFAYYLLVYVHGREEKLREEKYRALARYGENMVAMRSDYAKTIVRSWSRAKEYLEGKKRIPVDSVTKIVRRDLDKVTYEGYLNDAEIDAYGSHGFKERLLLHLNRDVEIEFVVPVDQIGLPLLPFHEFLLPGSTDEGETNTTAQGGDPDDLFFHLPSDQITTEFDGPCRSKDSADFPVEFVCLSYLGDSANQMVGVQTDLPPQCSIQEFVQIKLPKRLSIESDLADPVGSSVADMHGIE